MMDNEQINEIARLIVLELQGKLNEAQRRALEAFRSSSPENDAVVRRMQDNELLAARLQQYEMIERSKAANRERLLAQLGLAPRKQPVWRWMAAAAAVLLLVAAGAWFYQARTPAVKTPLAIHDMPPGKTGATLTLSNGKQLKLGDAVNGEIAQEAGISISKTASGQLVYTVKENKAGSNARNTLSTAKGETYQVRLPDGTAVWLNAASSLSYQAAMPAGATRTVELSGEGYFEVAQNPASPFVVIAGGQQVTVLGTSFNVNSYGNEKSIRTTLLSGKVKVKAAGQEVILQPGQESLLSPAGISVGPADVAIATAWKKGYFSFRKTDLPTIMRQLERWYNVEVEYKGEVPVRLITGNISREATLAEALEILTYFNLRTTIEEGKIIVSALPE